MEFSRKKNFKNILFEWLVQRKNFFKKLFQACFLAAYLLLYIAEAAAEDPPPPALEVPSAVPDVDIQQKAPPLPSIEDPSEPVAAENPQEENTTVNSEEKAPPLAESQEAEPPLQEEESFSNVDGEVETKIKQYIPVYKYDPVNKKDPFSQPGGLGIKSLVTDPKERLHPVEFQNIDDLKLRAIIWSRDGIIPRALFETADTKTYTLTKNDRVGQERAVIFRIDTDRVWLMKPFIDPNTGKTGYEPVEKKLSQVEARERQKKFFFER